MQKKNSRAIIQTAARPDGKVPLRGASGRLYGYLDPRGLVIEFKAQRGGADQDQVVEQVDLKPYIEAAKPQS